jgi:hypothetical protein
MLGIRGTSTISRHQQLISRLIALDEQVAHIRNLLHEEGVIQNTLLDTH